MGFAGSLFLISPILAIAQEESPTAAVSASASHRFFDATNIALTGIESGAAGHRRGEVCRTLATDSPSPKARSLGIRIEIVTRGDDGPVFQYRLRFLDADQTDSGLRIDLQLPPSVDQFLEALRAVLTLEVDDPRRHDRSTG
ncbi:MAG: hypothetical protein DMF84_20050 [Acidobacteria bacterium]|nr:MAG: hypothetical protein DMF84_20050 [Acidobacteriota bacterium]